MKWTGALLVDREGKYEFRAGGPTPDGEKPDASICEHQRWRVMLKRGQRTWILLQHQLARGARRALLVRASFARRLRVDDLVRTSMAPPSTATTRRCRSTRGSRSNIPVPIPKTN